MKLYEIKSTEDSYVVNIKTGESRGYVTKKPNTFTETILDPISLHNLQQRALPIWDRNSEFHPRDRVAHVLLQFVEDGYYIFRNEDSGNKDWLLVVHGNNVEILA